MKGKVAVIWGFSGVGLLLLSAIYRLADRALEVFSFELLWHHWIALVISVGLMAYAEGYRGFQQKFSPRVAARARYLMDHADTLETVFAPFFLMAYFRAPRKRKIISITLTLGIVVLILLVRLLPHPWRPIIDAGVVVGLAWGVISLAAFSVQAFISDEFQYSPEVPERRVPGEIQRKEPKTQRA